jgi:hypothetical protein
MKFTAHILLALAALTLSACQAAGPAPQPAPTVFTSPVASPDASVFTSPLPAPEGEEAEQPAVTGVLLRGGETPAPVGGAILYLGEVHFDDQGTPLVAGLDKQTAPKTQTDPAGRFVFTDAAPGTYTLIFDLIYEAVLLNDPVTGGDMLIEIEAGKTLDLGDLVYSSLPGGGPVP